MRINNHKGITLIELMVSITIVTIIMVPITQLVFLGYNYYYVEGETMLASQKTSMLAQSIINDLRKNENQYTYVNNDTKHVLKVKDVAMFPDDAIEYEYVPERHTVLKNGVDLFASQEDVKVVEFIVEETSLSSEEDKLIHFRISIEVGKNGKHNVQTSYRRRF